MHSLLSTDDYVSDAESAGLTDDDCFKIEWQIASNPLCGEPIKDVTGARKLRIPSQSNKAGGASIVVYFYGGDDVPVFLLNVFEKGDRVDLTKAERKTMTIVLDRTAVAYRREQKKRVTKLGENAA